MSQNKATHNEQAREKSLAKANEILNLTNQTREKPQIWKAPTIHIKPKTDPISQEEERKAIFDRINERIKTVPISQEERKAIFDKIAERTEVAKMKLFCAIKDNQPISVIEDLLAKYNTRIHYEMAYEIFFDVKTGKVREIWAEEEREADAKLYKEHCR